MNQEIIYAIQKYQEGSYCVLNETFRNKEKLIEYMLEELDVIPDKYDKNIYKPHTPNPYYMELEPEYNIIELTLNL